MLPSRLLVVEQKNDAKCVHGMQDMASDQNAKKKVGDYPELSRIFKIVSITIGLMVAWSLTYAGLEPATLRLHSL